MRTSQRRVSVSVSTHSRPKAAGTHFCSFSRHWRVSTHSRPKAAGNHATSELKCCCVSTHSRPKAAGHYHIHKTPLGVSFNTQPPEGGWTSYVLCLHGCRSFNTQPPEGGWRKRLMTITGIGVSTHSRPKAAGEAAKEIEQLTDGFNTQPPEGGWLLLSVIKPHFIKFQHTAARRRLVHLFISLIKR